MSKKEHGTLYKRAQAELQLAGLRPDAKSPAELSIYHTTLKLVDQFEKGTVSNFTTGTIKGLFLILVDGELINDITDSPAEWEQFGKELEYRNLRNPNIYSVDGGATWFRVDGVGQQTGSSKKSAVIPTEVEELNNGDQA